MELNVGKEIAALKRMTVGELRTRYAEVFGEETLARNKQWLVKRIIWRLQSMSEGNLSERARSRVTLRFRRAFAVVVVSTSFAILSLLVDEAGSVGATGYCVRLPDWRYPVVCDTESGRVRFDNFEGRWTSSSSDHLSP